MGRIVVSEFMSLDGVIEDPGGGDFKHAGWSLEIEQGDDGGQFKFDEIVEAEVQLLGPLTYEDYGGNR